MTALFAHSGLSARQNLPIPEWLFGWAAAAVLVVSFAMLAVLWPRPRLEEPSWRPLPFGLGRLLGSRVVDAACGAIGVALLALVIVAAYVGPDSGTNNFAPTFIFIIVWVGLVFASVLFGDVFRAFNPWRAIGRATGAALGRRAPVHRPYPERLGRWPAALGLLAFTWIELVSEWAVLPRTVASVAVGYTIVTLAAQAVWGVETWTRRGEAFSVYFNLFARLSPFETRDGVVGLRPLLGGLPRLAPAAGTVALLAVMIGTVTFDGFEQGSAWGDISAWFVDAFAAVGIGADTGLKLAGTLGLLAGVGLVAGFYWLGMEGARSVGGGFSAAELRRAFIHTLVPIAGAYVAAHYLTYLLFSGQQIIYLSSDPFGEGWDIFGTADSGIDYSLLSQNGQWYAQVGCVVLGHVAGLVLAHDRALALYGQAKLAVRSQYWMLGIMVGFTSLALWLLSQAG
ncbi:MAG: fenitrothion hydrolase [Solirubrobacteraceae bacterium]